MVRFNCKIDGNDTYASTNKGHMKLKKLVDKKAEEACKILKKDRKLEEAYKMLAETALVSSIIHNRKRAGNVQYFTVKLFACQKANGFHTNDVTSEFQNCLTETEKILT